MQSLFHKPREMEERRKTREAESVRLLGLSEQLLRNRDYSGCRKYALEAQQSHPQLAGDQILAVVDVLLASEIRIDENNNNHQREYYSILQLDPLCQDPVLIKERFKKLGLLLNPSKNPICFADEAFALVCQAWLVLSDPPKKADYDEEVEKYYRRQHGEGDSDENDDDEVKIGHFDAGSFWTACPYCYTLYEYERVYVDCCLRCQNCKRGFHAAVIPSPPSVVAGEDQYFCCFAFFPIGGSGNGEGGGGDNDGPTANVGHGFVKISDDNDGSADGLGNEKPIDFDSRMKDEFVMREAEKKTEALNEGKKPAMPRRKTVARNTKKMMGTGARRGRINTEMESNLKQ